MASLLFSVLCCFGKRTRDQSSLDESSRLIPTTEGDFSAGNLVGTNGSVAFDRAVYKDRLGSIVRSKEGYMVNVSSPLPFNLHNKPRAFIDTMTQGSHLSSSSRSASTSTFHGSHSPIHPDRTSRPPAPDRVRSGLRVTPIKSAGQSRSRSASQSSMSSTTSSQRDEGRVDKVEHRSGILGVRFVRGYGLGHKYSAQRGRAIVKQIEGAGVEPALLSMVDDIKPVADSHDLQTNSAHNVSNDGHPQVTISPASDTFEFRLHEVGQLSASWGD